MAEEAEVPKHVKEFYEKGEKIQKLLNTTEAVHSDAYHKGLDEIRDEAGEIDYKKLDDVKVQDKFIEKLVDHYLDSAVESLGLKEKPKDELEQDILLQRYVGITKSELKRTIRANKSKYTLKAHEGKRDELIKEQQKQLIPLKSGHLEDEHIEDILSYTGLDKYVDKDKIQIPHAVSLLEIHKARGDIGLAELDSLTDPASEGGWGSDLYLTKAGKEGIKALKEKRKKATG